MPRFQIECVDRTTGKATLKVCTARNTDHAREIATRAGFIVGPIEQLVTRRGVGRPRARSTWLWFVGIACIVLLMGLGLAGLVRLIGGESRGAVTLRSYQGYQAVAAELPTRADPEYALSVQPYSAAAEQALRMSVMGREFVTRVRALPRNHVDAEWVALMDEVASTSEGAVTQLEAIHQFKSACAQIEGRINSGELFAEALAQYIVGNESYFRGLSSQGFELNQIEASLRQEARATTVRYDALQERFNRVASALKNRYSEFR